ncbi:polysaccharide deacetylase family protein [Paenibacillus sp. PR3]|uniref:Polysaccharide deacetylase family protein n=1 Tax=Paenibacillus terricola TaxID=2763503 RepID=A0ABR8MTV8_9BACL|nr:polysaccharide deacetylase family protein [Paenibacillus terricola]MBD3919393.1 polysaccharide deacetylase family protein [Paenibacillus terricola]
MLQQIGYNANDRLLIINADDFGLTHGTNEAIIHLLESEAVTSTSIMMPSPKALDAMNRIAEGEHRAVGIHLTLTSDAAQSYAPVYRERPLSSVTRSDGMFHADCAQLERLADLDEVLLELEAQILRAQAHGMDITHLDSHAGSVLGLHTGRDFLEIVFDLCVKHRLPFNLPRRIVKQPFFNADQIRLFERRITSAQERGICLIDDMISLPYGFRPEADYNLMKLQLLDMIRTIKPGITQLTVHPSLVTDCLLALTDCHKERDNEYRLVQDEQFRQVLRSENIHLISWRNIRDLQRKV